MGSHVLTILLLLGALKVHWIGYVGEVLQGGNFGCFRSFFLKKKKVTKPDETTPFFKLSFVYHMLWMPKTLWLDLWGHV